MKLLLIIFSSLLLTSCSSIQLAFFFADRFIASRVGKSFDLNSRQEGLLRQQINKDLNSNKPKIGTYLDQFLSKIEVMAKSESISFEEFSKINQQLIEFRSILVLLLKPSIDQFISTSKDKNFEYYINGQDKEQRTDQKKVEGLETVTKFFMGSITKQQTKIFEEFVQENKEFYLVQFNTRKDFSRKVLEKITKDEKTNFIVSYLNGDTSTRGQQYIEQYNLYQKRALEMWYRLLKSTSQKQRNVLIKNLKKYRGQIQETFIMTAALDIKSK